MIIDLAEDFSSFYEAGVSKVTFDNFNTANDFSLSKKWNVVEVNRGGNNIVIDAGAFRHGTEVNEGFDEHPASLFKRYGRIAREVRTIFATKPKIEVKQINQIRNFETDITATFANMPIEADSILTMDITEVQGGLPSTMVLTLA